MSQLLRLPDPELSADVRTLRAGATLIERQSGREALLDWLREIEVAAWGRCPGYAAAAVAVRREIYAAILKD